MLKMMMSAHSNPLLARLESQLGTEKEKISLTSYRGDTSGRPINLRSAIEASTAETELVISSATMSPTRPQPAKRKATVRTMRQAGSKKRLIDAYGFMVLKPCVAASAASV